CLDAPVKLTWAKLNKRSGDADLSKDMSGPDSPPELRRSWCVEGQTRFGVISSVLAQQYLRTVRQSFGSFGGGSFEGVSFGSSAESKSMVQLRLLWRLLQLLRPLAETRETRERKRISMVRCVYILVDHLGHTTSIYTSWASLNDKRIVVLVCSLSPRVIVVMVCPFVTTCYCTILRSSNYLRSTVPASGAYITSLFKGVSLIVTVFFEWSAPDVCSNLA
ncbi:hypothetical protein Tco_0125292, partial [Tanacetum coccineum]